jgi:hypothetical protein
MVMVGLLWWKTGNDIHFREFHITEHLRTYTVGPSLEQLQDMNNGMEMMFSQQCSEAQVQVYAEYSG